MTQKENNDLSPPLSYDEYLITNGDSDEQSNSSYYLYISKINTKTYPNTLSIIIEQPNLNNVLKTNYWISEINSQSILKLTQKIGKELTLSEFNECLINSLKNKTANIKTLHEIETNSSTLPTNENNDTNRYLIISNEPYEYPICCQSKIISQKDSIIDDYSICYKLTLNRLNNVYIDQKLQKENTTLKNHIKLLESQRQLGAVDEDNIYAQYTSLLTDYDKLKEENEQIKKALNNINENEDLLENRGGSIPSSFFLTANGVEGSNTETIEIKQKKEINRLNKEVAELKIKENELKSKISSLESKFKLKSASPQHGYKMIKQLQQKARENYLFKPKSVNINRYMIKQYGKFNNGRNLPPISYHNSNRITINSRSKSPELKMRKGSNDNLIINNRNKALKEKNNMIRLNNFQGNLNRKQQHIGNGKKINKQFNAQKELAKRLYKIEHKKQSDK